MVSSYRSGRHLRMTGTLLCNSDPHEILTPIYRHRYWEGRKLWTVINLVSRNLALLVRSLRSGEIRGTNASIRYGSMFRTTEKTRRRRRMTERSLRGTRMRSPDKRSSKPSSRRRQWLILCAQISDINHIASEVDCSRYRPFRWQLR